MPYEIVDLTGKTFGRLTAVEYAGKKRDHMWRCTCECGGEKIVGSYNLRSGMTKSCGCFQKEQASKANQKHGKSHNGDPTYASWKSMNRRCSNPNTILFHLWGGRGITVCDRWKHSFENFLADMGPRPSKRHSIDRIDNDGHYTPENCKWATRSEQCRNTRRNRMVEYKGERKCVAQWSDDVGIPYPVIKDRLFRYRWPVERALTEPVRQ